MLRRGEYVDAVRREVSEVFGYDLRPHVALAPRRFNVSASKTVPPAMAAAFERSGWEETIRTVIGLGGDTDTLAYIRSAVAEAIHGYPPIS